VIGEEKFIEIYNFIKLNREKNNMPDDKVKFSFYLFHIL